MFLAFISTLILSNSGDYDEQLAAGESAEFKLMPKSLVLLHNYPKFSNKITDGLEVAENISQHYFQDEGFLNLTAKIDATAHISVIKVKEIDCDETIVSTQFETSYEISDTIYQEGKAVASFLDGKRVCFITTAPHYFNYSIKVNSGPHVDARSINGTMFDVSEEAHFTSKSVFISWVSSPTNNFSIKSVPTTQLVGYDKGDFYFYEDDYLMRGVTIAQTGNYVYRCNYPMSISIGTHGYIVMQNSNGGGYVDGMMNISEGPSELYFSFLQSKEVEMCDSISFSLDKNQYFISEHGNATFDITTTKCVFFSSPHQMEYDVRTRDTVSYVDAYFRTNFLATTKNSASSFSISQNPCLLVLNITSTTSKTAEIVITPIIRAPIFITNINAGKAHLVSNVFKYEQVTGVELNARRGDYSFSLETNNTFVLRAQSNTYVLIHNYKSFAVDVFVGTEKKGSINFENNFGVHFYDAGYLEFTCKNTSMLYFSVVELNEIPVTCKSLYAMTGSHLQFTVAGKYSSYYSNSNATYDNSLDICGWLSSPVKADFHLESKSIVLDKDYMRVYSVATNNLLGTATGLNVFEKEIPGEKSVLAQFSSDTTTKFDEGYALIEATIKVPSNTHQSTLGYKEAGGFRWITTDSDATVSTLVDEKSKFNIGVIISVSIILCFIIIIFVVAFIHRNKRQNARISNSSESNQESDNIEMPDSAIYSPGSCQHVQRSSSDDDHPSVYRTSDVNPYASHEIRL